MKDFFKLNGEQPRAKRLYWMAVALLLFACSVVVYWPLQAYPFVQDDWGHLEPIQRIGAGAFLTQQFNPTDKFLYRPLPEVYFAAYHALFGSNSSPQHIIALGLHTANALLVTLIATVLLKGSKVSALAAGLLYTVAANVHFEPVLWLVGMLELQSQFLALLAVLSFIVLRDRTSAIFCALGLLSKEGVVFVFPVLALLALAADEQARWLDRVRAVAVRMRWHGLVLALYGTIKIVGQSPLQLPPGHPYRLTPSLSVLLSGVATYAPWLVEAFSPLKGMGTGVSASQTLTWVGSASRWAFGLLGIVVLAALIRSRPFGRNLLQWLALGVWAAGGLAPVLFLADHRYQYYLSYTLVPTLLLLTHGLGSMFKGLGTARAIFVAWVVCATVSATMFVWRADAAGVNYFQSSGGDNGLVRRSRFVQLAAAALRSDANRAVKPDTLVFENMDVWAFDRASGPQLWLGREIAVYDANWIECAGDHLEVQNAPPTQAEAYLRHGGLNGPIRTEGVLWLKFEDSAVRRLSLEDVVRDRCRTGPASNPSMLNAVPNPVPAGGKFGTTKITWTTEDGSIGKVYVSFAGGPEQLFAQGAQGALDAPWIGDAMYEFRLYVPQRQAAPVATVRVRQAGRRD
jgi:hypothetical protein